MKWNLATDHSNVNTMGFGSLAQLEAAGKGCLHLGSLLRQAHPVLAAQQVVQDLRDGPGHDADGPHQRAHEPGAVGANRQPVARAQRLRDNLPCVHTRPRLSPGPSLHRLAQGCSPAYTPGTSKSWTEAGAGPAGALMPARPGVHEFRPTGALQPEGHGSNLEALSAFRGRARLAFHEAVPPHAATVLCRPHPQP